MNRDVDGAYVHFDDPLDFMLGEIGQRDIVAEKEGKTGVVVLKIQRRPKTFGQLVDETENALVFAGMLLIHKIGVKFHAGFVIFVPLFKQRFYPLAAAVENYVKFLFGHVKPKVENILNFIPVYGKQHVAAIYSASVGGGMFFDRRNFNRQGNTSLKEKAVSVCLPKTAV